MEIMNERTKTAKEVVKLGNPDHIEAPRDSSSLD